MRLSADHIHSSLYKVYLDGVLLENCIMADEERRYAEIYSTNSDGFFFMIGKDHIKTEFVNGKIEIIKFK